MDPRRSETLLPVWQQWTRQDYQDGTKPVVSTLEYILLLKEVTT